MTGILDGRAALITGASQGLGKEIAAAFLREGASIAICARDAATLEATRRALEADIAATTAKAVLARPCDVSKPAQVDAFVREAVAAYPHLDIVVNCAGVYGPKGRVQDNDWSEWVRAIEIDLFGAVLLARAVVPHLEQRGHGKFIQLSGGGATNPLPRLSAYAASKAAVVRFCETLALEAPSIDVNCIAPGALNTRMLDEIIAAGPEAVGETFYKRSVEQKAQGGVPLDKGAALAVWLASPASDGITGKLLSAVWDPWQGLPEHREDLRGDIYTLRRIVPGDRGKSWGDK